MAKDTSCICSAYSFDLSLAVIVGAANLSAGKSGPVTVHTSPETQYTLVLYSLNRQPQQVAYGIVAYPPGAPGEEDSSLLRSLTCNDDMTRVMWSLFTKQTTIQHSYWLIHRDNIVSLSAVMSSLSSMAAGFLVNLLNNALHFAA